MFSRMGYELTDALCGIKIPLIELIDTSVHLVCAFSTGFGDVLWRISPAHARRSAKNHIRGPIGGRDRLSKIWDYYPNNIVY